MFQGSKVKYLLDSGATCSFLSKGFKEEKKLELDKGSVNEAKVFLADNSTLNILGRTTQTIYINNQPVLLTFNVVDGLTDDVVLGEDFLRQYGVKVDWKRHTLTLQTVANPSTSQLMPAPEACRVLRACLQPRAGRTLKDTVFAVRLRRTTLKQPTIRKDISNDSKDQNSQMEADHWRKKRDQHENRHVRFNLKSEERKTGQSDQEQRYPDQRLRSSGTQSSSDNEAITKRPNYEECRRDVRKVMEEYKDVFEKVEGLPPFRAGFDFAIEFLSERPSPAHKKPYRLSEDEMKALVAEIDRLLELGYIEPTRSEWSAPVLFAKKRHKDAKLRLCVDFRGLNALTKGIHYPLPLITEAIDALQGHSVFSVFDISKAFQQIRVVPGHEDYLTLTCPLGQFQFKVMTFGLRNASGHFQHLITEILRGRVPLPTKEYRESAPSPNLPDLTDFVVVFMDDLNVCSRNATEHLEHVRLLLERLRLYGFKLNEPEDLATPNVSFLGYSVGLDGLKLPESKSKAICDWPDLQSRKNIQEFLGAVGYFRRFLPDFAAVATALTDLTGKNSTFVWNLPQQQAFEGIKEMVRQAVDLTLPDASKPFYVATDASKYGIGAVLMQMHEGSFRPVEFYSRKLAGSQRNWPSYESELYAIIQALRHWRHYLDGRKITLFSDHKPLEKIMMDSKLHSRKVANWISELLPYDLHLVHHAGTDALAMVPDALSRRPDYVDAANTDPSPSLSQECTKFFHRKLETNETWLEEIKAASASHSLKGEEVDGINYINGRIVIPPDPELRRKLLELAHGQGHRGSFAMRAFLRRRFWWNKLNWDITTFIQKCDVCTRNKAHKQKQTIVPQPTPNGPWDTIGIDFAWIDPSTEESPAFGFASVVDKFGKGVYLIPVTANVTGEEFAKLLFDKVISQRGSPKEIISDRDVRFTGEWWSSFFEVLGTKLKMTVAHRPQSDGLAERMHQTVAETLRCMKGNWRENLSMVEYVVNSNIPSPFRLSPMEVYGRQEQEKLHLFDHHLHCAADMSLKDFLDNQKEKYWEAKEILERVRENMSRQVNKGQEHDQFEVDETVMLSTEHLPIKKSKLAPRYVGPFKILRRRGDVTYQLELPEEWKKRNLHDEFNVNSLRRYFGNDPEMPKDLPELIKDSSASNDSETYEIERVLKHRKRGRKKELLVKWKGYEEPTWTDVRLLLEDAPEYVANYFAQRAWSGT